MVPVAQLMEAAKTGLFTCLESFRRYQTSPSLDRIPIDHFKQRSYIVRHADMEDLAAMDRLEKACWATHLRAPRERLARRVELYPEGQFVMELDGRIAGVIYSQRINDYTQLDGLTDAEAEHLHTPDGVIVQLLAANVDPDFQKRGLGDQLREFVLQISALTPGVKSVAGVTLCSGYDKHPDICLEDYIHLRDSEDNALDPTLRFHASQGARILRLVPGYRPADTANLGAGVLIEYDLRSRYETSDLSA